MLRHDIMPIKLKFRFVDASKIAKLANIFFHE